MKKIPIIIDCDPGKDDAFALMYAFKDEALDIQLITTVSGNVSVDKTTHNALGLTKLANVDIPVMKGSKQPLVRAPFFADDVHGKSGLGGFSFKDDEVDTVQEGDYIDEMYRIICEYEHEIVLVPIGPLTNIAKLYLKYPDVEDKIAKISLMGGGLKGGNRTISSEFNIYVDPEAAKIVFDSKTPIIMAGLDVTEKATVTEEDALRMKQCNHVGEVLHDIIMLADYRREDGILSQLNDVISIMVLSEPEMFESVMKDISVDIGNDLGMGMTISDNRIGNLNKPKHHEVLIDLDHKKFLDLVFERIEAYE